MQKRQMRSPGGLVRFVSARHVGAVAGSLAVTATVALGAGVATSAASATTSSHSCASVTKAQMIAAGFTKATGPKITAYNDAKLSANAPNALGETIDFGSKALVVSCVTPTDLKALSIPAQGAKKPPMSATAYLRYLVKTSGGSMSEQSIGSVVNYVDFGNGKEDGLGSTSTASSVRLDAFAAGSFLVLIQTAPVTIRPTATLRHAVTAIVKDLAG